MVAAGKRSEFRGWLNNFTPEKLPHALALLDSFQFFSHDLTSQMFATAFRRLANLVLTPEEKTKNPIEDWNRFRQSLIVTIVTGESPSLTDSGYVFARLARQALGLSENQIVSNEDAIRRRASGNQSPILFVDDFVGSGSQFEQTWEREHTVNRRGAVLDFPTIRGRGKGVTGLRRIERVRRSPGRSGCVGGCRRLRCI